MNSRADVALGVTVAGGKHEHKSATSAGGVIDSRHFDTRSAPFVVMDHRDLFDRNRGIRSSW